MLESADEKLIAAQMGRVPRGACTVAVRCGSGHPCVVSSYPLRRRGTTVTPFPTLYWLTCPRLCRQLSHLERDGAIAALEMELARDADLRLRLRRDHEDYMARRWGALTDDDKAVVRSQGLRDAFDGRGIGGIRIQRVPGLAADAQPTGVGVKCLHAHVAHHLVGSNVIGELVLSRYSLGRCAAR